VNTTDTSGKSDLKDSSTFYKEKEKGESTSMSTKKAVRHLPRMINNARIMASGLGASLLEPAWPVAKIV
jgi:hypothetical protein